MIEFDAARTARFFNEVYRRVDVERGKNPLTRLHARDRILLSHILPGFAPERCSVLDYGCGQGRLLAELLDRGFDAQGLEKHDEMRGIAESATARWRKDVPRVRAGGVEELGNVADRSCDLFIAMGVFQYLPKPEYDRTLHEIRRILKPGGSLVATYQNALFDLYTFNKYTVDFFVETLLGASSADRAAVAEDIRALLVNPEKPAYTEDRARDNIFVHLTNPLTIAHRLRDAGFEMQKKYFYEFFGLPPLIAARHQAIAKDIAARFEVDDATAWQGHFMANAFLVDAIRVPS